MIVSQDSLTTAAITGDREALKGLLARHHEELCLWVAPRIGRSFQAAFDADDVLQVTYMEAFLRIEQFEPVGPGAFGAWLRTIAEHNLKDAVRELSRKKRPVRTRQIAGADGDGSHFAILASLKSLGTTPIAGASRHEVVSLIEEALNKLPDDYAKVVRMYDMMGRSADEIARDMNKSRGAVHMLKARAHDRLAELLGASTLFFSRKA